MARLEKKTESRSRKPRPKSVRAVRKSPKASSIETATAPSRVPLEIGHPVRAMVFELETLAVEHGRKKVFDSARQVLSGAGVPLTPMLFSKMGTVSPPASFLSAVLQILKVRAPSQPRLKAEFDAECRRALCERPALKSGLAGLVVKVRARGIRPVAISLLDDGAACELMKATGLSDMDVQLVRGKGWVVHPYTENIVNRVVDRLGVLPGTCVAMVSSGAAAEAALCAGTRVVAVPDSFTSFHDFSGVDEVLDTWTLEALESVLSLDGEGH